MLSRTNLPPFANALIGLLRRTLHNGPCYLRSLSLSCLLKLLAVSSVLVIRWIADNDESGPVTEDLVTDPDSSRYH